MLLCERLRILMLLCERLRWRRKGVSRTGTLLIPVPAMLIERTVFGSLSTLLIESVLRGLNERSISFTLTRMLASEGITWILLCDIFKVSKLKYWFWRTWTGISVNILWDKSMLSSLHTFLLRKMSSGISVRLLLLASNFNRMMPVKTSVFNWEMLLRLISMCCNWDEFWNAVSLIDSISFLASRSLPLVCLCGLLVVLVGLAHHQDVVAPPEGVGVDLDRVQVGVGVGALGLVAGAPVVVPDWKFFYTLRFGVQGLGLVPDTLPCPVNPDVACLDPPLLLQLQIFGQNGLVGLSVLVHFRLGLYFMSNQHK